MIDEVRRDPSRKRRGKLGSLEKIPGPRVDDRGPTSCLVQVHPVVGEKGVRFLGQHTIIGRDRSADFCIVSGSVSRHHARIDRLKSGGYRVVDLASTNGTFVNDVRVREWDFDSGDTIRCGNALLRVLGSDDLDASLHEVAYMMMTHDSLTGAHNRPFFDDYLSRELPRAVRYGSPLSVMSVGVDGFDELVKSYGRLAADDLLRGFSTRLENALRDECVLARISRHTFGVIVQEASVGESAIVAERVRRGVSARKFQLPHGRTRLTASIGVASISEGEAGTAAELTELAEERLRAAFSSGGDQVYAGSWAQTQVLPTADCSYRPPTS